jgi:hypothetical protein
MRNGRPPDVGELNLKVFRQTEDFSGPTDGPLESIPVDGPPRTLGGNPAGGTVFRRASAL